MEIKPKKDKPQAVALRMRRHRLKKKQETERLKQENEELKKQLENIHGTQQTPRE